MIEFGWFAAADHRTREEGKPETFDFLDFSDDYRSKWSGRFGLGRVPSGKRMRRPLQALREALFGCTDRDVWETGRWLGHVLRDWLGYLAEPTSVRSLQAVGYQARRIWLRTLRRRSQRDCFAWEQLD